MPLNEQEVITDFLVKRMGIPSPQHATLPASTIQELLQNPRQGIIKLVLHLNRKPIDGKKLDDKVSFLQRALAEIQRSTSSRVGKMVFLPEDTETRARLLDEVIDRNETGFLSRESEFLRLLASFQPPAYLDQADLLGPFEVVRMNQSNPDRNLIRRRMQIRTGQADQFIALQNPYHFFYDLKEGRRQGEPENADGVAAFGTVTREMALSPSADSGKPLDFLVQYHELRHANQDANRRQRLLRQPPQAMESYLAFHTGILGEKPRMMAVEEATAYGYEMEALNVMLSGRLQSGNIPSVNEAARMLALERKDYPMMETLLDIAAHYYPEGLTGGNLSERFFQFIIEQHKKMGYDVFVEWSTGGIRQV